MNMAVRPQPDNQSGNQSDNHSEEDFSDRYLFKMLGRFVTPFWKQLLVVFGLLLVVTMLSLLPPYLIQRAVDGPITAAANEGDLDASHLVQDLIPYGVVYLGAIVFGFGLRFAYIYLLQTVGQSALLNLRQTLFEHILKQDMRFFNKTPVGVIVARLSNDVEALTELFSTTIIIVATNLVALVGIIIVMFLLNWRLALIALVVMPPLILVSGVSQ
jgi:ATP-binding cassette, subfamily B, multidrug efflux pump